MVLERFRSMGMNTEVWEIRLKDLEGHPGSLLRPCHLRLKVSTDPLKEPSEVDQSLYIGRPNVVGVLRGLAGADPY